MILGMKDAVKDEEKSQLLLDHSLWIDVPGKKGTSAKGNNDHYVAEQGEVCLRLILAWNGKTPGERGYPEIICDLPLHHGCERH